MHEIHIPDHFPAPGSAHILPGKSPALIMEFLRMASDLKLPYVVYNEAFLCDVKSIHQLSIESILETSPAKYDLAIHYYVVIDLAPAI